MFISKWSTEVALCAITVVLAVFEKIAFDCGVAISFFCFFFKSESVMRIVHINKNIGYEFFYESVHMCNRS